LPPGATPPKEKRASLFSEITTFLFSENVTRLIAENRTCLFAGYNTDIQCKKIKKSSG
jgi:hypothetical protein